MTWKPSPTIAAARDIGQRFGKTRVIVLMLTDATIELASWGRTRELCKDAGQLGDIAYDAVMSHLASGVGGGPSSPMSHDKGGPMDPVEAAFWKAWDDLAKKVDHITVIFHGPKQRAQARAGLAAAIAVARVTSPLFDSRGSLTGGFDGNPPPAPPSVSASSEQHQGGNPT